METYALGGRTRVVSGSAEDPIAFGRVELFPEAGCGGTMLGAGLSQPVAGDTAMLWSDELQGLVTAPGGARSARVAFVADAGSSPDSTSYFDNLFFLSGGIFADGFESGDTSAWTPTSPRASGEPLEDRGPRGGRHVPSRASPRVVLIIGSIPAADPAE